jgi:glycosyltransferase involved in cell wall biosynthesis
LFPLAAGQDPYLPVDRALSFAAANLARRTDAHLFLHCQYAYWAFAALPDRKRFMYQYHPCGTSVIKMLQEDFSLHPEVQWSFEMERDVHPRKEALQEWQMADGIVCASSFTKSCLVQEGCRSGTIKVVPYGIYSDAEADMGETEDRGTCRFLFAGQGVQRKGLHHLLKAWKLAAMKDAELVVVARRLDPGLRPLLDQPNIQLFAGVSGQMLKSLYQSSSIFVMPSLVEGFGLVYLEALAAGLHCIGTVNTGLPDLRLPNECVSMVPIGDIRYLVETLLKAAEKCRRRQIEKSWIRSSVKALTAERSRAQLRSTIAEMVGETTHAREVGIASTSVA